MPVNHDASLHSEYDALCHRIEAFIQSEPTRAEFTVPGESGKIAPPDWVAGELPRTLFIFRLVIDHRAIYPGADTVHKIEQELGRWEDLRKAIDAYKRAWHAHLDQNKIRELQQARQQAFERNKGKDHLNFTFSIRLALIEQALASDEKRSRVSQAAEEANQRVKSIEEIERGLQEKADKLAERWNAEDAKVLLSAQVIEKRFADAQAILDRSGEKTMSGYFADQAAKHRTASQCWLFLSAITLVAVCGYAYVLFALAFQSDLYSDAPMAQIVSLTFAKLAGFAIASVLLVFVSSNFKAHKHHEALYKFRAMVLKTVELISIAKNLSSELQSTLILEAFRAVCSEKASGYITKEDVEPATKMFSDAFMGSMRGDEK